MTVGILALQGDYEAHARILHGLGAAVREVRDPAQLAGLAGVVLPGGESTTMLNLMSDAPWPAAFHALHARGGALLGTCAGAIVLARRVVPGQASLGLLDATIARNAYGRQASSFEAAVDLEGGAAIAGVFIRAPRIRDTGPAVRVVARLQGEPVAVQDGRVVAATFHPEMAGETVMHRLFLDLAGTQKAT